MMQIPFNAGDHLFGYGRDSGGEEQELSVAQQERELRKWCQVHGLVLTRFFKDEARKGSSTVGRADLQFMMHEFRRGCKEKGVIVWKYNRFARSIDNAQFLRAEIRTLGYVFHSITDNVPEGPMGRIFEAAIDFKDEQFLIDLSIDTKRGLRNLVEIHKCVPGKAPTGIKRIPHQIGTRRDGTPHIAHSWHPNPKFAKRILKAFELRAARTSLAIIHKQTRVMGGINSYRTFFSNPIYKGTLKQGDIVIENYCEAMVPKELWEQVQIVQGDFTHRRNMTSEGVDHPRRATSRFLLSGLARCALCGSPLYGHSSKQKSGKTYDSYFCTRAYRKRDCSKKRIPGKTLENAIVESLTTHILTPAMLTKTYEELRDGSASQLEEQDERRKDLKRQLSITRKKIHNVTESLADSGASKSLTNRLRELENLESDQEASLAMLEATAVQPVQEISYAMLASVAKNFKSIYEKADIETQRTILRSMIDHVDVQRDGQILRGIIYWMYPPGIGNHRPNNNVPTAQTSSGPPEKSLLTEGFCFKSTIIFGLE